MNRKNENYQEEADKMMEGFYRYAGYYLAEDMAQSLDLMAKEAAETPYPPALDEWFDDYISGLKTMEKQQKRRRYITRIGRRAAMVLLAVGCGMAVLVFSVDAFRVNMFNLVTEITERYTSVDFVAQEASEQVMIPEEWQQVYLPAFVPEGYQVADTMSVGDMRILFYRNEFGDEIQFSQSPTGGSFQLDTEDAATQQVFIGQKEGLLVEKEGLRTLLWYDHVHTFYLIGNIDEETIIQMAESIQLEQ
ncbi:DUF4367 domain-containing protein [Anoxynatronum sibiricum]|uniref:DUF4367 domain-containing protein n=1 Tax=Anoxynatronum sibiricum TaxID=210623 RepID=A0ABU9VYF1_9CLOT